MKNFKIRDMALCALFAASSAVFTQIMIPAGPVPITLTLLSVYVAGGLLGAVRGMVSQVVFVLLGAVGVPVFSNFSGGFAIIAGPRGGYIIGYAVCAFAVGFAAERFGRKPPVLAAAMVIGTALIYTVGTAWYMTVTGIPLAAALSDCVWKFLPGDAVKIIAGVVLVNRLHGIIIVTKK